MRERSCEPIVLDAGPSPGQMIPPEERWCERGWILSVRKLDGYQITTGEAVAIMAMETMSGLAPVRDGPPAEAAVEWTRRPVRGDVGR